MTPVAPDPVARRGLRVAVLTHTAVASGAELALVRLVREVCRRSDVRVLAVVFDDGPLVPLLRAAGAEVRIVRLPDDIRAAPRDNLVGGGRAVTRSLRTAAFVVRLARELRSWRPDVVHCNSLKADLLGAAAARLFRMPVVWYLHDRIAADYLPARVATTFAVAARVLPTAVIANSWATRATLPRAVARRTVVAHPGVDTGAADAPCTVHRDHDPPTVAVIGRISPTKGQEVFVRAAADVHATHPATRFLVVGGALFHEDAYATALSTLIDDLGMADVVRLTGHVADPSRLLAGLTAVTHCSPTPEPFGQVIVESMAAGVPVIATSGGGVAEITGVRGTSALVVRPGDPAALAQAIRDVLEHPEAARVRAAAGRRTVRDSFTIARTAAVVLDTWRAAAAGGSVHA